MTVGAGQDVRRDDRVCQISRRRVWGRTETLGDERLTASSASGRSTWLGALLAPESGDAIGK